MNLTEEEFKELKLDDLRHEMNEEYYNILKMNYFNLEELPNTYRD